MPSMAPVNTPLPDAVSAWLLDRENDGCAPGTLVNYAYAASLFTAFVDRHAPNIRGVLDVEARHLHAFRRALAGVTVTTPVQQKRRGIPLAAGTQQSVMRAIKNFFNWLFESGDLPASPFGHDKKLIPKVPRRVVRMPNDGQIAKLLEVAVGGGYGPKAERLLKARSAYAVRGAALFMLLYDTGMRVSELVALDVGDYEIRTGKLTVRSGKGGHARVLSLGVTARKKLDTWIRRPRRQFLGRRFEDEAERDLEDAIASWPRFGEPVRRQQPSVTAGDREPAMFLDRNGHRMTTGAVRQWLAELCRRAAVPTFRPHDLRRAYATHAARHMPLPLLQQALGHADIRTTRSYIQNDPEELHRQMQVASPLDRLVAGADAVQLHR